MKAWNDRWMSERRKYGLVSPLVEGEDEDSKEIELWDGKPSKGGGAWW
jgi:DNA cross-link repair 1A protein